MTLPQLQPRIEELQCLSSAGLHRMAYKEWGSRDNPEILICVHGVTRVADDFDALAQALGHDFRVICPDVVGRGRSGHLRNPALYQIPQYVSDMVSLIARVTAHAPQPRVHWLGTSMGGLIGFGLASLPESPLASMLVNDVGPSLNFEAVARIADYIGQDPVFPDFAAGLAYVRTVSQSFGAHTDAQWEKMARDVLRQQPDGTWRKHYDVRLAQTFKNLTQESAEQGEAMLWAAWDAIRCPTLLVRGAQSDLLTLETARAMCERGPRPRMIELPEVGHAPTFVHADQIAIAQEFFLSQKK
ncbi:alpha/beta hydrolase [Massilia sp. W12]|uniref:alpha/beta fold hydrolase n=1 Tax=Massilia sp. W12 TaxID=3126507 RepID=UPI0030CC2766